MTSKIPLNTIKISEKACEKVKEFAANESRDKYGLKVAVRAGGCSGLEYILEIVDGPDENDKIISQNGLEVYIPKKAYIFFGSDFFIDFDSHDSKSILVWGS